MKEIEKYLKTRIGKYSFFFEDLRGGFTYGYNENEEMIAAGCIKLPIAMSLIKAEEDKKVMEEINLITNDDPYDEMEYEAFDDEDVIRILKDLW